MLLWSEGIWWRGLQGTMCGKECVELSQDDCKVIDVLRTQARLSLAEIAKEVGFSQQKVSRIMTRLEKEKVIWGYCAIISDGACGLNNFYMLLKRSKTPIPEEQRQEVMNARLEDFVPGQRIIIENIQVVHGAYTAIVSFLAEDISAARKFSNHFTERYGRYFTEIIVIENILSIRRQGQRNRNLEEEIKMLEFL